MSAILPPPWWQARRTLRRRTTQALSSALPHAKQSAPDIWHPLGPAVISKHAVVGLAMSLLVIPGWGEGSGPPSHSMKGVVDLRSTSVVRDSGEVRQGSSCHGSGGYQDLREGGQVLVVNEANTTIASGSLSAGTFEPSRQAFVRGGL